MTLASPWMAQLEPQSPRLGNLFAPQVQRTESYITRDGSRTVTTLTDGTKHATSHQEPHNTPSESDPNREELHAALKRAAHNRHVSPADQHRLGHRAKNVEIDRIPTSDQQFGFEDARAERTRWLEILPSIESNPQKVARFEDCGNGAFVYYDTEAHRYTLRCNRCKLRVCPTCRIQLQKRHAQRIRKQVGDVGPHEWQFITLTMRHTTHSLRHQLKQLRSAFRKVRNRKCWKTSIERGYAVIEIGWNGDTQEWHPHLHVVAKTRYIDWAKLRSDWKACTHGSDQIDCRWIKHGDEAIQYVCKYVGKPPDQSCLARIERAAEYYEGLKSGRMLIPFGPHPKIEAPTDEDQQKAKAIPVMSLADLCQAARNGWKIACEILEQLQRDRQRDADFQRSLQQSTFLRPGSGVQTGTNDTS